MTPLEKINTIISVFGRKGSGKSHLVKETVEKDFERVIAIDNLGEYDNMKVIDGIDACKHELLRIEKGEVKRFKYAFRTTSLEDDLLLIDLVFELENLWLIVEEASRYVSTAYLPEPIEKLIRYGRHKAISQIYIARRPSELHRDITAQSDVIITFRQQEPRDIRYLRDFIEDDADKIPKLGQYKFYAFGDDEKLPYEVFKRKYNQVE